MSAANLNQVEIDWKPDKKDVTPVYKQIVEYVSAKISSGDWAVGQKLPSQRKLAELFSVNRSTVVNAIDELISYGILASDFGGGTFIESNTWGVLFSTPPDWGSYVAKGNFHANFETTQRINALCTNDEYIQLGSGELDPDLFPKDASKRIMTRLADQLSSLRYLEPLGLLELRRELAERLQKTGIDAKPSNILITSGGLQALHLISLAILQRGSVVYTEMPSYINSLQVFQSAGVHLMEIPMDQAGIRYDQIRGRKKVPENHSSLIYTIPNHHSPTGITMSEERRNAFFTFCQKERLPVIEDDAYGELWFDNPPPKSLKARDKSGMVLYIGTVSKSLAPGLRIGWLVGPESVVTRLGDVKMQSDYGASTIAQWTVYEFLRSGEYDAHLSRLRKQLKERRDVMLQALSDHFSDLAEWNTPQGGFYIWLTLKKKIPSDTLFNLALDEKILLSPGNLYSDGFGSAWRLSFSYANDKEIKEGIQRFAEIVRTY